MNGDDSEAKGGRECSALFNVEQNRGLCPAVVFGAGLLFAAMPFRGTPTVSTRNSREDEESVDKGARFENWIRLNLPINRIELVKIQSDSSKIQWNSKDY
jgi:hypothetical protein